MIRQGSNEVVVIGVVYPGIEIFLKEYLDSLERQTCHEFDLLLVNDGLGGLDTLLEKRNLSWLSSNVNGSVSSNRRILIHKALDVGYQKIVFTDIDDTFADNRIEVVCNMLERDSIIVNDLDITEADGNEKISGYLSRRFSEVEMITDNSLLTGNMMGLSNTAVRMEVLQDSPALIAGDSIAFDWYLWSSVLLQGNNARFTCETSTKYRNYGNNTAGLPQCLNEENIIKGVEVKRQHYKLMSQLDGAYSKMAKDFQGLCKKLEDKNWFNQYTCALKEFEIDNHMWWENIRTPSEIGL